MPHVYEALSVYFRLTLFSAHTWISEYADLFFREYQPPVIVSIYPLR